MDALTIKKAIDAVSRADGFTRKGSTWSFTSGNVVSSLLLRKSTHGDYFYLDVSVKIIRNGELKGDENSIHLNASKFVDKSEHEGLARALDLELSSERDIEKLIEIVRLQILPKCRSYADLEHLKKAYREGELAGALVGWRVRDELVADG